MVKQKMDRTTEKTLLSAWKKFHLPGCSSVNQMSEANKQTYNGSRDDLISQGHDPCKRCNPKKKTLPPPHNDVSRRQFICNRQT